MAGERTLPGLGLTAFWELADDTWKPAMDTNIRTVSVIAARRVLSRVTALPGSPAAGAIYIVPSGATSNANQIAVWDGAAGAEAWVYLVPSPGWSFYVQDEGKVVLWDGTAWVDPPVAAVVTVRDTKTASYALAAADFSGNKLIRMNVGAANTVTVPAGLTVTESVTVVREGAGATSFVAASGVTIKSAGGLLGLRVQYSSATLIPDGADAYYLVGDLV